MPYDNLILERHEHIAIITLNHPPVNAWNLGLMEDFEKALNEIEGDKEVRVVILTGGGRKMLFRRLGCQGFSQLTCHRSQGPRALDPSRSVCQTGYCSDKRFCHGRRPRIGFELSFPNHGG